MAAEVAEFNSNVDDLELAALLKGGFLNNRPAPGKLKDVHAVNTLGFFDDGVVPPKRTTMPPFFHDATAVTNAAFEKFVSETNHVTIAESDGWSWVVASLLGAAALDVMQDVDDENGAIEEVILTSDPDAPHFVAVRGASWHHPEGVGSNIIDRMDHPVVHVNFHDAAAYCSHYGRRLAGEREFEIAARGGNWNRNGAMFGWGDSDVAKAHLSINSNSELDGYVGTAPVRAFEENALGIWIGGNVWEWTRGGKPNSRILRGGSFLDSLWDPDEMNEHIDNGGEEPRHVLTVASRTECDENTSASNIGFRCAKSTEPNERLRHGNEL